MVLFKIDRPTPEALELCETIVTSTEQLVKAVSHMPGWMTSMNTASRSTA
jgi:hypothetical protein